MRWWKLGLVALIPWAIFFVIIPAFKIQGGAVWLYFGLAFIFCVGLIKIFGFKDSDPEIEPGADSKE